jgi:hypothetical protein
MQRLIAGFSSVQRGRAAYRGALRPTAKSLPVWTCTCTPVHLTPGGARECADVELERRKRSAGVVFTLLHCKPCASWRADSRLVTSCPRCGVPLERVKLAVLERGPAG